MNGDDADSVLGSFVDGRLEQMTGPLGADRVAAPITSALNSTISLLIEQALTPLQQQINDLRKLLIGSAQDQLRKHKKEETWRHGLP